MRTIDEEQITRASFRMQEAADRAQAAADRMEAAAHRIAMLLEDGYGGNGLRLIEAIEKGWGEIQGVRSGPVPVL